MPTTPRVFISFDFDHDDDLRYALVGQARYKNSPFQISNWSVKEAFTGNWKQKVRDRIAMTSLTVVICGHNTHTAAGVSEELKITRELEKPYFLLWGRAHGTCMKPRAALPQDKIYAWNWNNLQHLLQGTKVDIDEGE